MSQQQMNLFGEELSKADAMNAKADEWVRRNHDAWRYIRAEAVKRAEQGRRFGIGELAEQVRWHMHAEGVDSFKLNNTLRAPLARRLVRECPQVAPYIEMRKSVTDL